MANLVEDLTVTAGEEQGIPVLTAQGDIDLCTTDALRTAFRPYVDMQHPNGASLVALDMRNVLFIDSAGLALLVEMRQRLLDKYRLALIIAQGSQPERVLKLGRFDTVLQVCYSPDELVAVSKV